eukprot:TRINITY_DN31664_c0_g1_i1.p1 TRINITY_DN31664_c0_g1~~TRINITY_DN31664_c0_g1_i1.p1  ORF type:complete len:114 (+),score=7.24 TRINITY_DN31664_c0_g1_i1:49-390(+)
MAAIGPPVAAVPAAPIAATIPAGASVSVVKPAQDIGLAGRRHHHHHHYGHRRHHHHHHRQRPSASIGGNTSNGSSMSGYHFTLPTNQGFDISPGNLHLPKSTTGYTITYSQQG